MHKTSEMTIAPNSICNRLIKQVCHLVMTNPEIIKQVEGELLEGIQSDASFRSYGDKVVRELPKVKKMLIRARVNVGSEAIGYSVIELPAVKKDGRLEDCDHLDPEAWV